MNELPQNSVLILEGKSFRVGGTSLLPLNPVFEQCHSPMIWLVYINWKNTSKKLNGHIGFKPSKLWASAKKFYT